MASTDPEFTICIKDKERHEHVLLGHEAAIINDLLFTQSNAVGTAISVIAVLLEVKDWLDRPATFVLNLGDHKIQEFEVDVGMNHVRLLEYWLPPIEGFDEHLEVIRAV